MVEKELADRVALVTGGAGGIGSAISIALAQVGVRVAVNYLGSRDRAIAVVQRIAELGGNAAAIQGDVSSIAGAMRLAHEAASSFNRPVQILVNSAGVIPNTRGWREETDESMTNAFSTNASAAIFTAQAVFPGMRDEKWGRIINISSIYGDRAADAVLSYCMSKAALDAASKALAVACATEGVTVNSVAPGNIDTAMTRRAGDDYIAYVQQRTPMRRLGVPREVADAVLYLCSSPFVTGARIVIDGGLQWVG